MEGISVEYFSISVHPGSNEKESGFHSYKSGYNEKDTCYSHAHMFHLFQKG